MINIPLAWLQLCREKNRLLIALAGIAFAVILMFMQLGFQAALYDSAARLHQNLQGDIVLISTTSKSLSYMNSFSWRRLYQTLSFEDVESISPLYVGFKDWKNPETGSFRTIYVFGFQVGDLVFNFPEVNQYLNSLKLSENILFDRASRSEYGPIAAQVEQGKPVVTELGSKRVNVVGLFSLGPSFAADGSVILSDLNFFRLFPDRRPEAIDIGLVRLKPNAEAQTVVNAMQARLPKDVRILTRQDFIEFEKNYWQTSTAIGFIFTLGASMGFVVGTVIVYQILYSDVSDHLSEYATLKAMGYRNSYLLTIVFQEAVILAVLGYIPGFSLSLGLYDLTKNATFLPLGMAFDRAFLILLLTILMCSISGVIAIRRLRKADPADVF